MPDREILKTSVKDVTKCSKVLTIAMEYFKIIVLLIKLYPKLENILGEVKVNLEGENGGYFNLVMRPE